MDFHHRHGEALAGAETMYCTDTLYLLLRTYLLYITVRYAITPLPVHYKYPMYYPIYKHQQLLGGVVIGLVDIISEQPPSEESIYQYNVISTTV